MEYVSPGKPWDNNDDSLTKWHSRLNVALIRELAAIVHEIAQVDNDGWTLIGYRGRGSNDAIVLNQWGLTTFSVFTRGVHLLVPASNADSLAAEYSGTVSKVGFPDNIVRRLEKLSVEEGIRLLGENRQAIHDAHRLLQSRQDTSYGPRRSEHRPELVETLSGISGIRLEQPSYFTEQEFPREEGQNWLMRDPSPPIVRDTTLTSDNTIRMVWPTPNVDLSTLPMDKTKFKEELTRQHNISDISAQRLYDFVHGIEVGDNVGLHSGIGFTRLAVAGTVVGPYEFSPNDSDYPHQRAFEPHKNTWPIWHRLRTEALSSEGPVSIGDHDWRLVLEDNNASVSHDITTIDDPEARPDSNGSQTIVSTNSIRNHFAADGLHYSDTQIADFYTALQTKGFVVLSGISGTGKSKIATGFTEMLPNATHTEIAGPDPVTAYQALRFKVSQSQTWAAVSAEQSHLFPKGSGSTRQEVNFIYEGATYSGAYKTRILNYGKPTLYLILGSALTNRLRRAAGDDLIHAQFRAAPHEQALPEIHITLEEPRISNQPQEVETFEVPNTLFLSVRPDWRDSTSLLGYYNPLTKTYEWTEFLRFILNAAENYRSDSAIAWFVILDEMNLAHVEYYFADLLSVLESGREANPEHPDYGFTQHPLRLTYPDIVANEAPPSEIKLPPNLYIIGTVNMDETTHAFSPKVLDRAFTMELTEVDFTDYPRSLDAGHDSVLDDTTKIDLLRAFSNDSQFPQIRKDVIRNFVMENEDVQASIQRLNSSLAKYRFHFGYRVFDEIMQFLANAESNGMYPDLTTTLDSAAFMKILPKFSGSEARIGLPLAALIEWAEDPFDEDNLAEPLNRTLDRARFMQRVLQTDGFVTAF